MKYLFYVMIIVMVFTGSINGQEVKKDTRPQMMKVDSNNRYKSDQITNLDIIQALEVAGIGINKINFGRFDKKYNFHIIVDEYKKGKLAKTETILSDDTEYYHYEEGRKEYFIDYLDQMKIFTRSKDNCEWIHFSTYKMGFKKDLRYKKTDEKQFYLWRSYSDTHWKLNQQIPLMVFASSWKDPKHGFQRFCGVAILKQNDKKTQELLSMSPHYFMVSYKVTEIKGD